MTKSTIWYALKKGKKYLMYTGNYDYGSVDNAWLFKNKNRAEKERENGLILDPKKSKGEIVVKIRITKEEIKELSNTCA